MGPLPHALQFFIVAMAGWINQQQRDVIDYLQEENRVLREHLSPQRLRFTNAPRRRLAAKAKTLGRKALAEIETRTPPAAQPVGAAFPAIQLTSEVRVAPIHALNRQTVRRSRFHWLTTDVKTSAVWSN